LDAGTGLNSLQWISHLLSNPEKYGVTDYTAVTASPTMAHIIQKQASEIGIHDLEGHLVFGNWFAAKDEKPICDGELYDTILVDYLIGAMDAFSPYKQDCIFDVVKQHMKPGGRIYLVGMEPIPSKAEGTANLVCKVKNIRDACILLAGERCYREYPLDWTIRTMKQHGLHIIDQSCYKLLHLEHDVLDQLGVAKSMLHHIDNPELRSSMEDAILQLECAVRITLKKTGPIHLGFDYLVVAEVPGDDDPLR
jgi:hypothetical protein